jgi:hypothetical protein
MKKAFLISLIGLMFAATGLAAGNDWSEAVFVAKHGRNSAMVEAQQKAAEANTAYREDTTGTAPVANAWREGIFMAKSGRFSPVEEARQNAARANTAWREEPRAAAAPVGNAWREGIFRMKFGRSYPINK